MALLRRALDREGLVKSNITQTLIDCVKELQLKFAARPTGFLTNDEATNTLCFCLEAIFIHGLKNTFLKSMSSALTSTGRENQHPEPCFWEFVLLFCHQEVILQISSFSHIHTDIGRCRTWLRVILNDGLLISYIQLILADKRTLKEYYKPSAFLRDVEQCDIMKSYLYGVETYDFKLACNSSLLNSWNSTPLSLVGLLTPSDSIAQGIDVAENMDSNDLQALPNLKIQSSAPQKPIHFPHDTALGRAPLLEEEEALRVILSAKGSQVLPVLLATANSKNSEDEISKKLPVVSSTSKSSVPSNSVISNKKSSSNSNTKETIREEKSEVEQKNQELLSKFVKSPIEETKCEVNTFGNTTTRNDIFEHSAVFPDRAETESLFNTSSSIPIPSNTLVSSQEEGSYAQLFQSYNKSDGVIGTPITIGSFLESNNFLQFQKTQNETTTSSDPALGSSLEDNHSTSSPRGSCDFDTLLCHSTSSEYNNILYNLPQQTFAAIQSIPNETGLDVQNYMCKQCEKPIGMFYGEARVCGFSGNYYCTECHLNEEYVIPSRIMLNWDFTRFTVCAKAKLFLQEISNKPIFDLSQINPMLYKEVEECAEVEKLRIQLQSISIYLKTCKKPGIMDEFEKSLGSKTHIYQQIHLYSITDLLNIPNRLLCSSLNKSVIFGINHIKGCDFCKQKGFVCEVCRDDQLIFPFELEKIYKCKGCGAVYDKDCMNSHIPCPRCIRWKDKIYEYDDEN